MWLLFVTTCLSAIQFIAFLPINLLQIMLWATRRAISWIHCCLLRWPFNRTYCTYASDLAITVHSELQRSDLFTWNNVLCSSTVQVNQFGLVIFAINIYTHTSERYTHCAVKNHGTPIIIHSPNIQFHSENWKIHVSNRKIWDMSDLHLE